MDFEAVKLVRYVAQFRLRNPRVSCLRGIKHAAIEHILLDWDHSVIARAARRLHLPRMCPLGAWSTADLTQEQVLRCQPQFGVYDGAAVR